MSFLLTSLLPVLCSCCVTEVPASVLRYPNPMLISLLLYLIYACFVYNLSFACFETKLRN